MSSVSATMETPSLGPRKTLVIMVTVVGCIAFLWPKVFYPMMLGGGQTKTLIKDHRGSGCCDVVLDQDNFGNVSLGDGEKVFRKRLNILTGEIISIRQERPPHLRPESIHPAMRERGRNIPPSHTVPIIERTQPPPVQPRVVEGRPGPIPGMRPPMGAGSVHQSTPKSSTMGFLMPLYTIAIVSFFIYTVMRLVLKKPNIPYTAPLEPNPTFHKQVFDQEPKLFKRPDDGKTKLGLNHHHHMHENGGHSNTHENGLLTNLHYCQNNHHQDYDIITSRKFLTSENGMQNNGNTNDTDDEEMLKYKEQVHLMEINQLRKKLQETERAMATIITQMVVTAIQGLIDAADEQMKRKENATNLSKDTKESNIEAEGTISNGHANKETQNGDIKHFTKEFLQEEKKKSEAAEKEKPTVKVVGMEMTATVEGGHKWGRPLTPSLVTKHSKTNILNSQNYIQRPYVLQDVPPPQSIYLEGTLPHESQILIADNAVVTESIIDEDVDADFEEPTVVLSSKMTLSLISLDPPNDEKPAEDKDKNTTSEELATKGPQNEEDEEEEEYEEEEEEIEEEIDIKNETQAKPEQNINQQVDNDETDKKEKVSNVEDEEGVEDDEEEEDQAVDKIVIEEAYDYDEEEYVEEDDEEEAKEGKQKEKVKEH